MPFVRLREARAITGLGATAMRRKFDTGVLPGKRWANGDRWFDVDGLRKWCKQFTNQTAKGTAK